VVERLVTGVDAKAREGRDHPAVHQLVCVLERQPCHQLLRCADRVGDRIPGFDEHRAAAADPAHHLDAVAGGALGVDFVAQRLEASDHHRRGGPFPDPQGGGATAGGHLGGQDLVQRHVQGGRLRAVVDELPVMPAPGLDAHARSPASMARRTASATPSAVMPYMWTSGDSLRSIAAVMAAASLSAGRPSSAALISPRAESGSRKKSPLTRTPCRRPPLTPRSTTTSLPPGILYSPCLMPAPSSCCGHDALTRRRAP